MDKADNKKPLEAQTNIQAKITERKMVVSHGENVRHYRRMKGYSQEYMAHKLRISQPKYSEIERNNVIDEVILNKIAQILNIGVEWLRDIPLQTGTISYFQDGNGTNFQNTGDVHYEINYPVETVKEAYESSIDIIKSTFEIAIADKNAIIEEITKEKNTFLEKLMQAVGNIKM